MSPFFTIIIPTYNVEKLLPQALNSILEQDFCDYEVIIMDGLSKDNTIEIANEYKKNNSKIKVFSEKDLGIYDAMNKAIKLAKGNYLFFLGSDDRFYAKNVFSQIYNALNTNPVDVIYGDIYSPRFNGIRKGFITAEQLYFKNICHQSVFFKKSVFNKTGYFNLTYTAHADYEHNIKWFFNKKITKRYQEITIAYYADGGFSSLNGDPEFEKDKKHVFFKNAFKHVSLKFYFKINYPKIMKVLGKIRKKK